MNQETLHIILSNDDEDDRILFTNDIGELIIKTDVTTVENGVQLLDYLNKSNAQLPNVVFMDLNMPHKTGMEYLKEIRSNSKLKDISVVIYSTSASEEDIEETFVHGANVHIKKPNNFSDLKNVLSQVISVNWQYHTSGLNREYYLLKV